MLPQYKFISWPRTYVVNAFIQIALIRYQLTLVAKAFSTDWTSPHLRTWSTTLNKWRNSNIRILEIGSWEGRSALFFLTYLRRSTIVCIDPFEGNSSLLRDPLLRPEIPYTEARFDYNLRRFNHRVEKIKDRSYPALCRLLSAGRQFELIYIDGSHRRDDVTNDSNFAWSLLTPGGIIIWDDYDWCPTYPPEERPQPAIDAFLQAQLGRYSLLSKRYQVIIQKNVLYAS
jgi:predicted O-methyltransferase YrrM